MVRMPDSGFVTSSEREIEESLDDVRKERTTSYPTGCVTKNLQDRLVRFRLVPFNVLSLQWPNF
jgi:hypothetical protein